MEPLLAKYVQQEHILFKALRNALRVMQVHILQLEHLLLIMEKKNAKIVQKVLSQKQILLHVLYALLELILVYLDVINAYRAQVDIILQLIHLIVQYA